VVPVRQVVLELVAQEDLRVLEVLEIQETQETLAVELAVVAVVVLQVIQSHLLMVVVVQLHQEVHLQVVQ
jgi:hypothetical protein